MATGKLQENLSKYFYSGIALAAHTADVVQKSVDEFVKHGKMNEADGKKIVGDAMKKVELQRSAIEAKYNETLHKLVHLSSMEVSKLQKRIEHLEKKSPAKRTGTPVKIKAEAVKEIKRAAVKGEKSAVKAKKRVAA